MEYSKGDTLSLTLHGFSPDGRTVGRTEEGLTVFVQGGVPGQRVLVRLVSVKKRLADAELAEVLTHAPEERPAPCPHAAKCGGCPWQSLPYPAQLHWKGRIVKDALRRIGRLDLPDGMIRPVLSVEDNGPAEWGTRNKMEFAFENDADGRTRLGLRSRASRSVVEVEHCLLQTPRTMTVLAALRSLCAELNLHAAPAAEHPRNRQASRTPKQKFSKSVRQNDILRFAVIREPRNGGCLVELITLPSPQEARTVRRLGESLMAGPWGVTGFVHSVRTAPAAVAYGESTVFTLGDCRLTETLSLQGRDVRFQLDHNSFFQVNSRAAELLYNTAAKLARPLFHAPEKERWGSQCWDIYCGAGGLALTMSPHFDTVRGLEAVAPAIELANANAAALGEETSFTFESGDAAALASWFKRFGAPDLLVTDPPRAGMDERTVQAILKHQPPRLILVSCNPATLARDLALLAPAYDIGTVQPVDLFPQTPHIETVVSLTRKGS